MSGDPINQLDLDGLESGKELSEAEKGLLNDSSNGKNRRDGSKLSPEERKIWNRANEKRKQREKTQDVIRNGQKQRGQPNRRAPKEKRLETFC